MPDPTPKAPAVTRPLGAPTDPDDFETDAPEEKASETIPGGAYVQGGRRKGSKHFGGQVVNANGEVLVKFKDNEENTGIEAAKAALEKKAAAKKE